MQRQSQRRSVNSKYCRWQGILYAAVQLGLLGTPSSLSLSLSLKAVVWLYIFPRSPLEKYPSGVHDTSRSEVTGNDTQQLGDETTADDEDESEQPELADGALLGDLLLDDGFGLSTLDFLLLCEGLVGATLLGCLNHCE